MPPVGRASVLVGPSFSGFQRTASREMDRQGPGLGRRLAGGLGTGLKRGARIAGAGVAGVLAVSLTKGFERLSAIENAEAKLRGLGNSGAAVKTIMKDALASVKGTAFGMGEAATTAAGAVAAGIKPGKELEGYLRLTADAATIAGISMEEMGSIINKTTTAGKVQADNLNQLADRGIPIFQWLAEEYGVSATELSEMVRKGEVDSATFRKVIEENIGGAALESGNTTQGAFKNMMSALGRVGANLLTGVYPQFQRLFVGITNALGPVEDQAKVVGEALGRYIGIGVDWLVARLPAIKSFLATMAAGLSGIAGILFKGDYSGKLRDAFGWDEDSGAVDFLFKVREGFAAIGAAIRGRDLSEAAPALASIGQAGKTAGTAFQTLLPGLRSFGASLPGVASAAGTLLGGALQFLADHMDTIIRFLPVIVGGWLAYNAATKVAAVASFKLQTAQLAMTPVITLNNILRLTAIRLEGQAARATATSTAATASQTAAENAGALTRARSTVATVAATVAQKAMAGVQRAAAAAQWLLNAAMSANPIGIIIVAVAALVAGLIYFFTQTKTGQEIVRVAFAAIGAAATWLWEKAIRPAFQFIAGVVTSVGTAVVGLWKTYVTPALTAIGAAFSHVGQVFRSIWQGWISPVFQLIGAIIRTLWEKIAKPIFGWLGTTFLSLGKGLMSAYVTYIKVMFTAAGAIITWLWTQVAKPLFGYIQDRWHTLSTGIQIVWNQVLKPALDAVGAAIRTLWNSYFKPRLDDIKTGFSIMGGALKGVWDKTVRPAFDALKRGVSGVKTSFDTAVGGIRTAWDKIKGYAKAPIKFVIDTVINRGLIAGFNKLARTFGTDEMEWITLPSGFDRGGILPGTSTWRQGDDQLVPMRRGEGVTVSEALRDPYERHRLHRINAAALAGMSMRQARAELGEGMARGGVVQPVPGRGNRHTSGYGWATYAGDFPQPSGTPVRSWKDGVVALVKRLTTSYGQHVRVNHPDNTASLYAHLSRIAVTVGQVLKAGQTLGNVGSTGNSTGPHLHFETTGGPYQGGSGTEEGGGLGDFVALLKDALSGPLGKLRELGDNPFAKLVSAVPRKIAEMLTDKASRVMSSLRDAATSAGLGLVSGAQTGSIAVRYSGLIAKHLAKNGMPLSLTDNFLRQIKSESGGNPRAVQGAIGDVNNRSGDLAHGLLQVIGATFAAYRDKSLPNDRFNPEANIAASIRYVKARYGAQRAESFIGAGHGYWRGTQAATPGLHPVAERGIELVLGSQLKPFRGGEQVLSSSDTRALLGGGMQRLHPDDMRELAQLVGAETVRGSAQAADRVTRNRMLEASRRSR